MRLGLIGPGQHGKRFLLRENGGDMLSVVCRKSEQPIEGYITTTRLDEALKLCDRVVVATPPDTHREIVTECLRQGKHVLVEKPLALTWEDCHALIAEAALNKRVLLVSHTHLWHEAFKNACFGDVKRVIGIAGNRGPMRSYSALLDWGPHDVAMAISAVGQWPESWTRKELSPGVWSIDIKFPSATAEIVVGNGFQGKIRRFEIYRDDGSWSHYSGLEPAEMTPMKRMVTEFGRMTPSVELDRFNADTYRVLLQ